MSAIAGVFNQDGRPVAEEQLKAMTAVLAPLGRQSETFWHTAHVGFGSRLSWFTEEDGFDRQPLTGRDGRYTLVTVARIYNRPELAESLGISPSDAGLMPDSAFVMAALEKWGEESLGRLIGSFALAAYNRENDTLLLARDPGGQRPLYYWTDGRRLAFASAPRALFQLRFIPRNLNLQRVADHLVMMRRAFGSPSWYEGLVSVEPGYAVVASREGLRTTRFWQLDPERETRYSRDSDYVEAFNALWQRTVGDHMRSRTGVGIQMSGGLDSTAIAAVAAPWLSQSGKRLSAFTEVPPRGFSIQAAPGRYTDETPLVQAMARKFPNIDLNFITEDGGFFLDGVEEHFRAAEAPGLSGFNRLWIDAICSAAASRNLPVLLTGQAGNLTISWYGRGLMPHLLARGRWLAAWREARGLARTGVARSAPAALAAGVLPLLPDPVWTGLMRARYPDNPVYVDSWKAHFLIAPEFAREQRIDERALQLGHDFRNRPRRDIRNATLGPEAGEGYGGRAVEARFGIEVRTPATDRRIVEFCMSIPEDQFLRNGVQRWLIRRAMRGTLPEEILNSDRRGLQSVRWRDTLGIGGNRLREELALVERSPLVQHTIDLPRLRGLLDKLEKNVAQTSVFHGSLAGLTLTAARFLVWTETGN